MSVEVALHIDVLGQNEDLGDCVEGVPVGPLQLKPNREIVELLVTGQGLEVGADRHGLRRRIQKLVKGEHDVVGGERRAVMPAHALPQVEGHGHAVVGHFPALREPWCRLPSSWVRPGEAFEDELIDLLAPPIQGVELVVQRGRLRAHGDAQDTAPSRLALGLDRRQRVAGIGS